MVVMTMIAVSRMRIRRRHHALDLADCHSRQEAEEQEEEGEEQTERTKERRDVEHARPEVRPARRDVVTMKARHDDDEAFEPHTDVHENRDCEHGRNARPDALEPEKLRREHVAAPHRPIRPLVRTECAVCESKTFVFVSTVPSDEVLHRVRVTDHRSGHENDLVHVLEVPDRDQTLESERLTRHDHQGHDHREAAEDSAGDEVGREDRRVPTGHDRDGEVERHDRMHGEYERRRKTSQDQVRTFVREPVSMRPAPTEGEDAEDNRSRARFRAIPQRREIRNETDVPEQNRYRRVRRDGENVPEQGALEVWPHAHLVRNWEKPICEPHATDVEDGINRRCHNSEDRHRFRCTVDARTPLLPKQEENGADERSGVTDTDPENEPRDVPGPKNRIVQAPDADTFGNEFAKGSEQDEQYAHGQRKENYPRRSRFLFDNSRDRLGNRVKIAMSEDQRCTLAGRVFIQDGGSHTPSSSGLGFLILAKYDKRDLTFSSSSCR